MARRRRSTTRRTRLATGFFTAGSTAAPSARALSVLAASSMRLAISSDSFAAGMLMRRAVSTTNMSFVHSVRSAIASRPLTMAGDELDATVVAVGDALDAFADDRRDAALGGDDARLAFFADERQALDELGVAAAVGGQGALGDGAIRSDEVLRGVAVVTDDVGGDGVEGGGHGVSLRDGVATECIFSANPRERKLAGVRNLGCRT